MIKLQHVMKEENKTHRWLQQWERQKWLERHWKRLTRDPHYGEHQIASPLPADRGNGLSDAEIERLLKNLARSTAGTECSICREMHYENLVILDCLHRFCRDCFLNWFLYNSTCPLCRRT